MNVILMGVSGCGKTVVGRCLSRLLGWPFFDADDYHPAANVEKMRSGTPLADDDRWPWLDRLNAFLRAQQSVSNHTVLGCSALRQVYRDRLASGLDDVRWVYLKGDFALIESRLRLRRGHYMPARLLQSQFDTLEEPLNAMVVDITSAPDAIASEIVSRLDQPLKAFTTASVERDSRN